MELKEYRINDEIRANTVRVIGPDGKQLGIMPIHEALQKAEDYALDLVEVAPNANPPVCKIMDYGKFKYEMKKKLKEAQKKQHRMDVKEMKFRPKTEEHDLQFKIKHIRKFLSDGDKVKVRIVFRGRELAHKEQADRVINRVIEEVRDIGEVEKQPSFEGRQIIFVIVPRKKGEKKGG